MMRFAQQLFHTIGKCLPLHTAVINPILGLCNTITFFGILIPYMDSM